MAVADRFRTEADMLEPLATLAERFLPDAIVLFEVACTAGIPDIVLVDIDHEAVAQRVGTAALTELIDVRVVLALQSVTGRRVTSHELSGIVRVSVSHLKRSVLPRLVEGGHVVAMDGGWFGVGRWRSLARRVVTVEAKRRDWRRGLAQASRHTAVADEAWLVLDAATSGSAASHRDWFATYGVGLASLSVGGALTTLIDPSVDKSRRPQRELLIERAIRLHRRGEASGPIPQVFGAVLTASTGVDPRLGGGSGRSIRPAVG